MSGPAPERLQPRNVILVGAMGTGKSASGQALAARLGWDFADTDAAIERKAGMSIPQLFEERGEAAFRALETETARALIAGERRVISTGGGILKSPGNREMLEAAGAVVLLQATAEAICERIGRARHRPLIDPEHPLDSIRRLLEGRRAMYEQIRMRVDTTNLSPEEVAVRIVENLEIETDYTV